MKAFLHALTFLTRLPVRIKPDPQAWNRSVAYYPLVGAVIGLLLFVAASVLRLFYGPALSAVLLVALWVWLTGGLHLDGLMDTADGLGSSRSRERMLEIMKDSRVGAMGVLAAVLVLAVKGAAVGNLLASADTQTLLALSVLPPVLGRAALLLSIAWWPYLTRDGKGIAEGLKQGLTPARRTVALTACAALTLALAGPVLAVLLTGVFLFTVWRGNYSICRRLGGLTGDTYGALLEVTETVLLLAAVAYLHRGGSVGW